MPFTAIYLVYYVLQQYMTFCMSPDIYGPNIRVIAFSEAYEKAITTLSMIYDL